MSSINEGRRVRWGLRWMLAAGLVSIVAIGIPACGTILGTGSYVTCGTPDASWYEGDCLACVQANCCDQASACASDPSCSLLHDCMGQGYPALECPVDAGVVATASSTFPRSDALTTCAAHACSAQCAWGCAGRVPPPPMQSGSVTVTLRPSIFSGCLTKPDTMGAGILSVGYCTTGSTNCPTVYDGGAASDEPVQIEVPFGSPAGYLDVTPISQDAGVNDPLHSLVYLTWPLITDTTIELRFLTQDLINGTAKRLGAIPEPADATLVVFARDCQGNPATDVKLFHSTDETPDPFAGADGFAFSDCFVHQQLAQNVVQDPTTTSDGVAGWASLNPNGQVDGGFAAGFNATTPGGVQIASTITPSIQSHTVTYVWLTPTAP